MRKKTHSILTELENIQCSRDTGHLIESRADHVIASAINLLELIESKYSPEDAENLTRKLLNSIKLKDSGKFKRSLGRINENKRSKNK